MSRSGGPHIHYVNMGPWPGFFGVALDEKSFRLEMKRLHIEEDVSFISGPYAHATLHSFDSPRGDRCYVLAMSSMRGRTREQVAGLVAHEAMHVIQHMQDDIAHGQRLGIEAEAYLMQMMVQEALQEMWRSGKERRRVPAEGQPEKKGSRRETTADRPGPRAEHQS